MKKKKLSEAIEHAAARAVARRIQKVEAFYDVQRKEFIMRNQEGRWLTLNNDGFRRILRAVGISSKAPRERLLSAADEVMLRIQNQFDVQFAGPLAGSAEGFHDTNGIRYLVTSAPELVKPTKGAWSNLHASLSGLLRDSEPEHGTTQLDTFHGWMRAAFQQLLLRQHGHGQAITFCGPPSCGKSLLQHIVITPMLGNRSAKAMRYMQGKTDFNLDLAGAEHLILDDEFSDLRAESRRQLGANLKQMTVGTSVVSVHGKNRNAVNLRVWWRVSISVNDEPEAMMVLPPLDSDIADKIILLRCHRFEFPMPMRTQEDKTRFREQVRAELPAYAWWLLNEFQLPVDLQDDRYGVASFHHPELVEALHGISPEAQLLRLADEAVFWNDDHEWKGTAEELRRILLANEKTRRDAETLLRFPQVTGGYLARLARQNCTRVQRARSMDTRDWIIRAPLVA